jgi:hypothetical protein
MAEDRNFSLKDATKDFWCNPIPLTEGLEIECLNGLKISGGLCANEDTSCLPILLSGAFSYI